MKTIASYCQSISEKTLFIFCNDCFKMPPFIENPNAVVTTAFANLVNKKNGFDKSGLRYYFENEKVKQVLVTGHCNCEIISFLSEDSSQNPHWAEARQHFQNLQNLLGRYSLLSKENKLEFLLLHISFQVKYLQDVLNETGLSEEFQPLVKGIVIDENCNEIIEAGASVISTASRFMN